MTKDSCTKVLCQQYVIAFILNPDNVTDNPPKCQIFLKESTSAALDGSPASSYLARRFQQKQMAWRTCRCRMDDCETCATKGTAKVPICSIGSASGSVLRESGLCYTVHDNYNHSDIFAMVSNLGGISRIIAAHICTRQSSNSCCVQSSKCLDGPINQSITRASLEETKMPMDEPTF